MSQLRRQLERRAEQPPTRSQRAGRGRRRTLRAQLRLDGLGREIRRADAAPRTSLERELARRAVRLPFRGKRTPQGRREGSEIGQCGLPLEVECAAATRTARGEAHGAAVELRAL